MRCLVLQHVAFESLGVFAGPLEEAGYTVSYVQAGIPEDRARKTCSCTVDGMKEAGIWTDFLRERLSAEQGREVTAIARACLARNPGAD